MPDKWKWRGPTEDDIVEHRWKTANGQELTPSEMSTSHIENSLALLRRQGYVSPSTVSFYASGPTPSGDGAWMAYEQEADSIMDAPTTIFIDLFEEELEKRAKQDPGSEALSEHEGSWDLGQ